MVVMKEAFEAKRNVYFNYEFNLIDINEDFPDVIQKSLVGLLYKHEIESSSITYCIYFTEELYGAELEKLQTDWLQYCPID